MKRFGYLRDRLFLSSSTLYALNRWGLKPRVHSAFLHGHFNDLLLIPCALPVLLLMQRWLRLREHDQMPTGGEVALYLAIWSVLFEWIGPHIIRGTTGDVWDVAAYAIGAIIAACWWRRDRTHVPSPSPSGRGQGEGRPAPFMSFDTLAPHYRWMEWILAGEKLQRCRTAFLPKVKASQNVLILGEGNGRFLVECRRALPQANITGIDASAKMLAIAERRLKRSTGSTDRTQFIQADALTWRQPKESFDLIVTHFFLDCFCAEELEVIVEKLANAALPQAAWLIADFAIPPGGPAAARAKLVHRLMYTYFRIATGISARQLTAPDKLLERHGFALARRVETDWGMLRSDLFKRE